MRLPLVIVLSALLTGGSALAQSATPATAPSPAPTPRAEREITPVGALWRSALLPGWGQRYKGESRKGWIFTGIAAGLVAGTLASAAVAQQARSHYDHLDPASSEGRFNSAYDGAVRTQVTFEFFGASTAAFWGASAADSAFTPVDYLRVKDAKVRDVFPSLQRYYQSHPLVSVSLVNRSGVPVSRVRVTFEAKDVMHAPAQSAVADTIPAGLGKSFDLTADFDDRVFDVGHSEAREVPAKLTIEYEVGRKKRQMVQTATFTVYGRNAIVWDDARKLASFVTPRDEAVASLDSAVGRRKLAASPAPNVAMAAALFDALGADGITYLSDPNAPFSYFEGNAVAVDNVNYPRETLTRKTGDCDDLTSLYASLLEGAGIRSALVDVPGHVYVMFDSGAAADRMRETLGGAFVTRGGEAWVPVEVTAVGRPFAEAWSLGASESDKWGALGKLNVFDTMSAQAEFAPAPPAFGALAPGLVALDEGRLSAALAEDAARLGRDEGSRLASAIAALKARRLSPASEANEIGILYANAGRNDEAAAQFATAIRLDPTSPRGYNNLGSIAYARGDLDGAIAQFRLALTRGEDPLTFVNLARAYFEKGDTASARDFFARALRLDGAWAREYPDIDALVQGDTAVAAGKTAPSGTMRGTPPVPPRAPPKPR